MAKKHNAKQVEISFGQPEPFKLAIQTATDGDRVAQETAQLEADQQRAENNQTKFFAIERPAHPTSGGQTR